MGRIAYAALLALILIGYPPSSHPQEEARKPEPKHPEPKHSEPAPGKSGYNLEPQKRVPDPTKPKAHLNPGHTLADEGKKKEIERYKSGSAEPNLSNFHYEGGKETEEKLHERPGPCEEQKTNQVNYKKCLEKQPKSAPKQDLNAGKTQSR